MNKSFCNSCNKLVPAERAERDGKIFLVKQCPDCGPTETLISADAGRYNTKRSLDGPHEYNKGCGLHCLGCQHKNKPSFIFVDITNRCNSNCPICINNTPSMGFLFEPPFEYFDKLFEHFSHYDPRPAAQLFGGEPTVRDDVFDIIALARSYGLPTRVVTNGLKLADEDYCRKLVASKATILIAYDGHNPETYRVLRGSERYLAVKQKAFENLAATGKAKVAIMTCIAKDFNDGEIPDLLKFCHERRDFLRGVYFLPLAEVWKEEDFDLKAERITSEDIEIMFDDCFPEDRIDFLPAGVLGELGSIMGALKVPPPPFAGAHPNCESMYVLISNGEEYLPLGRYLKSSVPDMVRGLFELEAKVTRLVERHEKSFFGRLLAAVHLKRKYLAFRTLISLGLTFRRHVKLGKLVKGRGIGKLWHALGFVVSRLLGRKTRKALERHSNVRGVLQIIVLPFEDNSVLETERLERCPNAFAFYDPREDRVDFVPTCAWGQHKATVLRGIADFYAQAEQPEGN